MVAGIHWEWRGFGSVSYDFVKSFCKLPEFYEPKPFDDIYIWIPNLRVNTKYRDSEIERGLKFKRQIGEDGDLEQWIEREEEIFEFPLTKTGWNTLANVLADVNLELGSHPSPDPNRDTTISHLKNIGCKTIPVPKIRASKIWESFENHQVIVEWVSISAPQMITSIGLETLGKNSGEVIPDEQAKEDILMAIEELGVDNEQLAVMNYLDAVNIWASGEYILKSN